MDTINVVDFFENGRRVLKEAFSFRYGVCKGTIRICFYESPLVNTSRHIYIHNIQCIYREI